MRIIVDVDCTVADFVEAICSLVEDPDRTKASKWNWFSETYTPQQAKQIRQQMEDHRFWSKMPVLKDANKGIAWLRGQGHELVWVTAPYKPCFGWCDARREWLNRNFSIEKHDEPLIFTRRKHLVCADMIIDDLPENVDTYAAHHPKATCLLFWSELTRNLDRKSSTWEDIMSMSSLYYGRI